MRIDIKASGFPLTKALIDYSERRLRFALTRHSDRITRITLLVGDSNGPRGGIDKFCRIRVLLKNAPGLLIEDTGSELYAVIDRAVERAGQNVAKRIDRLRTNLRHAGPKLQYTVAGDPAYLAEN